MNSVFKGETVDLIRLAGPVVLSRAGMIFMLLADTMMVGRHDSQQLAYIAISLIIIQPMFIFSLGLIMGTQVMTAISYGARQMLDCGFAWRRGAPYAVAIGLIFAFVSLFSDQMLRTLGLSEDLAIHGGEIASISGYSLPFVLLFLVSASFLEGIKRPMPGVIMILIANLVNVALNWIMIYGNMGAPVMGAAGAVWATNTCRFLLAITIIFYILNMRDHEIFGLRRKLAHSWSDWKRHREIGYAAGFTMGVESIAFNGIGLFAGWMGVLYIGAHAIIMNLLILVAMVSIGIGSATGIMVGIATGAKDIHAVRRAGWTGFWLVSLIVSMIAIVLMLIPEWFGSFYTNDVALMDVVAPAIVMLGVLVVFDGGQLVLGNALRGRGETWAITIMNIIAFLIILLPLAWWLAFKMEHGLIGLYEAVFISCVAATIMFAIHFHMLSNRDIRGIRDQ